LSSGLSRRKVRWPHLRPPESSRRWRLGMKKPRDSWRCPGRWSLGWDTTGDSDVGILCPGGLAAHDPFCDALDVTFPIDRAEDVRALVVPRLLAAGAGTPSEGLWRVPRLASPRIPLDALGKLSLPTVKMDAFGSVFRLSFSGGTVATLSALGEWMPLLADVWSLGTYRVTRLDTSVDLDLPGPAAFAAVRDAARTGEVRVGRKRVPAGDVETHEGLDLRGDLTGTVYLGRAGRELRLKVYDKRHEIERKTGVTLDRPWTRVELSARKVQATTRDAGAPGPLFWHYVREVITPPDDALPWTQGDSGFDLEHRRPPVPWQVLKAAVERSLDLQVWAKQADLCGPTGRAALVRLIAGLLRVAPHDLRFWVAARAARAESATA